MVEATIVDLDDLVVKTLLESLELVQDIPEFKPMRKHLAFAAMWYMTYDDAVACDQLKKKWVRECWKHGSK